MKKAIIKIFIIIIFLSLVIFCINIYVKISVKNKIINIDKIKEKNIDCILVLGASIKNNSPSPMLEDRLLASIDIYKKDVTDKILVSGDHTEDDYDEVTVMKKYLVDKEIPSKKIFMDHSGISTYDSIYRAKKIYKANKIIIVTQKYHLYRALYIAKKLDIDAIGISADRKEYQHQSKRDIREIAARIKDFIKCIIKPEAKYMGKVFPINGNGDKTNDK